MGFERAAKIHRTNHPLLPDILTGGTIEKGTIIIGNALFEGAGSANLWAL